ncbi:hypothetical protein [Gracilimonas sediminicola]|uniref:Uncharacterized protein n=1 Tax=Gracilimonas sediminicola TaxID=2952158 RepID=A0A9X2L0C4_9BACT|nr:hypothetical protein [Gracilimonas sediminicola]MCP9290003.1 hypothetical protein [Gracilimonas sediminicola]
MPDNLKAQFKITYTPDSSSKRVGMVVTDENDEGVDQLQFNSDMTGTNTDFGTQDVGTSEETLDLSADVGDNPYIIIKNTDDANYVEVGLTSSYSIQIPKGEIVAFRANGTMTVKADTAEVKIQYWAFEK